MRTGSSLTIGSTGRVLATGGDGRWLSVLAGACSARWWWFGWIRSAPGGVRLAQPGSRGCFGWNGIADRQSAVVPSREFAGWHRSGRPCTWRVRSRSRGVWWCLHGRRRIWGLWSTADAERGCAASGCPFTVADEARVMVRYKLSALWNGVPTVFSDDPAIGPGLDDPNGAMVVVRVFQSALRDANGQPDPATMGMGGASSALHTGRPAISMCRTSCASNSRGPPWARLSFRAWS